MALTVYVGNASPPVSSDVQVGTFSVTETLGQRTTCEFVVRNPVSAPAVGNQVIAEWSGQRIFGGTVDQVETLIEIPDLWAVKKDYRLQCIDFSQILDRRTVGAHTWTGELAGTIARYIVTEILDDETITEGTIQDGPTIERFQTDYESCTEALSRLATLAGFRFYVDYDKQFYFYASGLQVCPFGLTTIGDFQNLRLVNTREDYANLIVVKFESTVIQSQTEDFAGDGTTAAFELTYPMLSEPVVTLEAGSPLAETIQTLARYSERRMINSITLAGGGSGYLEGDTLTVNGGNGDATVTVDAVDGSGTIQSFTVTAYGTGYSIDSGVSLLNGSGIDATVDITSVNSAQWYWAELGVDIIQDDGDSPIAEGETLHVGYSCYSQDPTQVFDQDAIDERKAAEGGSGRYDAVITVASDVGSDTEAEQIATAYLNDRKTIPSIVTFETNTVAQPLANTIRAGQVIALDIDDVPEGDYLMKQVRIFDDNDRTRLKYSVQCVLGPPVADAVQFFQGLGGGSAITAISSEDSSDVWNSTGPITY